MRVFGLRPSEEGVEERGLADIAAAQEGDFGEWRGWEGAEVGGAEEDGRGYAVEEGGGVLELSSGRGYGSAVGVQSGR